METKQIEIKCVNGEYYALMKMDKQEAIKMSRKKSTHTAKILFSDNREKSWDQVKLYWAMLDEFAEHQLGEGNTKESREVLKEAMYEDYRKHDGSKFRIQDASVTEMVMFMKYVIDLYSEVFDFVPKNALIRTEFSDNYVYACLANDKCAICGKSATVKEYDGQYISLCYEHEDKTKKELANSYYLPTIKLSDEIVRIMRGENE